MPTYDYKCKKCEKRFSKLVPLKDKDYVKCPQCDGETEQLFTGFLYKRTGGGNDISSSSCTKSSCSGCKGC